MDDFRGADRKTQVVLLVEDDESLRYAFAKYLGNAGLKVFDARDAFEALQIIESGESFDLMVTDIGLPTKSPHGFAVGRMAQLKLPGLKVLYVTGLPSLPKGEVEAAEGRILHKPVEPAQLLEAIREALAE